MPVIDTPDYTETITVTAGGRTDSFVFKAGSVADNTQQIQAKAANALTANATFLAIVSPTNAQVVAQVQTLTKECNGIIRLLLGQLDSTAGT